MSCFVSPCRMTTVRPSLILHHLDLLPAFTPCFAQDWGHTNRLRGTKVVPAAYLGHWHNINTLLICWNVSSIICCIRNKCCAKITSTSYEGQPAGKTTWRQMWDACICKCCLTSSLVSRWLLSEKKKKKRRLLTTWIFLSVGSQIFLFSTNLLIFLEQGPPGALSLKN